MGTQSQRTDLQDSFDLTLLRYYHTHVGLRPPTVEYTMFKIVRPTSLYTTVGGLSLT